MGDPTETLGFARIDHDRERRCGFPEVIYAERKTPEEAAAIAARITARSGYFLATRATPAHAEAMRIAIPHAEWHPRSRIVRLLPPNHITTGNVTVVCAGTADLPVAEEAALTAECLGATVVRIHDVGVAGLHRILAEQEALRAARVLVVVAGMEGALPSVVGGLVDRPVIAVPTSVGYGASLGGIAALLGMLNACAPNITVTNIDNGFGAGYVAALINRESARS